MARKLSATEIANLMSVSEKIANLNVERFRDWQVEFDLANARQAMFAFKGDVYTGLDAYSLSAADIEFAQQHLRGLELFLAYFNRSYHLFGVTVANTFNSLS